ncbi:MAG TPA: hypothetical protein PKE00_07765, partial [Planctomycetota bacterium]|nr:hypothetical protein [Planctomycetota bacterium]
LSNRSNAMWWRGNSYFWSERRSDFERVAKKVLELQEDSPARIAYVANYLWNGLASHHVAIEALLAAEARGILQESTLRTLASWCMSTDGKRPSVTLRIVDGFLEDDPLRLDDRLLRAKALMSLGRADEARSELIATEHLLREGDRWTEGNVAALAQAAISDVPALDLAVRYFKEAIAMRDKALGGVARPDWTISFYYAELTRAHVGQKQWAEAFAAARSALVTADARHNHEAKANEAMDLLLRVGPLKDIIAMHDQEVARSGQDAALLRKLFGSALLRQRSLDEAIVQLQKATELQPDDPATWDSLVAAHDQNKAADAALEVLRQSLDVLPFDLERTTAYATRLEHAKQHELAMRAWTQLVELRPDEAVSHERLAASFERHLEWPSALQQWRRVTDIRPEEPKSWFGLADAQARSGANDDARATLRTMMAKDWEARFGDVKAEVERRLGSLRG